MYMNGKRFGLTLSFIDSRHIEAPFIILSFSESFLSKALIGLTAVVASWFLVENYEVGLIWTYLLVSFVCLIIKSEVM